MKPHDQARPATSNAKPQQLQQSGIAAQFCRVPERRAISLVNRLKRVWSGSNRVFWKLRFSSTGPKRFISGLVMSTPIPRLHLAHQSTADGRAKEEPRFKWLYQDRGGLIRPPAAPASDRKLSVILS